MRTIFIVATLLVCLVVYSEQTSKPKCGPHQVYKTCGTACPRACDSSKHHACPAVCKKGCFCGKGYVLVSKKSKYCIPEKDCPKCPYHNSC
ncbi:chymotrypsin-elastase inhibitor ixodidin [Cephus cinctus]|uniref:Chymotrypsin-elastase inhibitor ixodidin n=1 Tax=Cephus cinctus TaxID=211228 RepID=A0AAJ7FH98_CEPCN|nr:chymotrypsin-elastase inhibitor ixodidin [Cephus cinctus]